MTDRAQPGAIDSLIRNDELRQIFSRFSDGFIVPSGDPTIASQRREDIDATALDAFSLSTSAGSLEITVSAGEGFTGGWFCRDRPTTLTLPANSTVDIVVGYNDRAIFNPNIDADRDDSDEVIVGLKQNVNDALPTTTAHQITTDSSGVVSTERIGNIGASISVDRLITDSLTGVQNDIDLNGVDLNNVGNLGPHSNLSGINSSNHHTRYSDSEASNAAPVQSVNGKTGQVDTTLQACRVVGESDQSIPSSADTKINFSSSVFDSDNNFDFSNDVFICPKDGMYQVNLQVAFSGGFTDETRIITIGDGSSALINNSGARRRQFPSNDSDILSVSTVNQYESGDGIAGYAKNADSSDLIKHRKKNSGTFLEVCFLGEL